MTNILQAIFADDQMEGVDSSLPAEGPFGSIELGRATAEMLPYHIMLEIFLEAVEKDPDECEHGGKLARWDANASLVDMPRICSAWEDAAITALYRSVALFGGDQARLFLRTLEQHPERGLKVKSLVIGVKTLEEQGDDKPGLAEGCHALVRAITFCPNLRHLQVRPLHYTVREALFSALRPLELETLVCAPRAGASMQDWSAGLYAPTDIVLAKPTLKTFELDFGVVEKQHLVQPPHLSAPPPVFLPLVEIRLHCDLSDEMLWALLAAAQHLQVCDLYFEKMMSADQTATALRSSINTIRNMRFICNPTWGELNRFDPSRHKPIFDLILPHQMHLHELAVSATEISTSIFRLLPPRLAKLEAHSFNHVGTFVFHQGLVDDMLDPSVNLGSLQTLIIHDTAAAWTEDNIRSLNEACKHRGVSFTFLADEDEYMSE